ncbi:MAG: cell envelope integrity protein CreD [Pseudomonadota bacterium]
MQYSLIIKIGLLAVVGLLLLIPLEMIFGVVSERSSYRLQVEREIAQSWTGTQILSGPILVLPYEVEYDVEFWDKNLEEYVTQKKSQWEEAYIVPEMLTIDSSVATEKRWRGLYGVPVYTGEFSLIGQIDPNTFLEVSSSVEGFKTSGTPSLSIHVQDVRGIGLNPKLIWQGETLGFESGTTLNHLPSGIHAVLPELGSTQGQAIKFEISMELRGSRQLMLVPTGENSRVTVSSPWPHPSFTGKFLPTQHQIDSDGFFAEWQVSSFSTSLKQTVDTCLNSGCRSLLDTAFGIGFIDTVDIYQQVTRATKYGVLFILLTFVVFFLTEVFVASPLHPIHYGLVGFALTVFFLLLLSLSEHIGFGLAYGISALACVGLLSFYMRGVLQSRAHAVLYSVGLIFLYLTLYVILQAEDFALLMGSVLLFIVLSTVMIITRKVDWYRLSDRLVTSNTQGVE